MKILTPEEEQAHDSATWKGGIIGSLVGLAAGVGGVTAAGRRFHAVRAMTVPLKGFIVVSSTAFAGVINADRSSRAFERARHGGDYEYRNESESDLAEAQQQKGAGQRLKQFLSEQRYPIVFGTWVAGMGLAFALVSRHPTLTGQQKLVQARVYAQGLTLAVLVASFGLEGNDMRSGKGRWETVKVLDPNDPEHKRMIEKQIHHESYAGEDQWMDMIESSEQKMKSKGHRVRSKTHNADGTKKEGQEEEQSQNKGKGEQSKSGSSKETAKT